MTKARNRKKRMKKATSENTAPDEITGAKAADGIAAGTEAGSKWTTKSVVAAVVIAAGVVAIPLYLKSNGAPSAQAEPPPQSAVAAAEPTKALPRFVDLGTTTCAPCKVMLGVMAELESKYPGAFVIEFVNVQERQAELQRYGVQIIPSQIFFAPDGRELYRHTGVFRANEIIAKWAELGFHFKPSAER